MKSLSGRLKRLEAATPDRPTSHLWNGRPLSELTMEELLQARRAAWQRSTEKLMATPGGRALLAKRAELLERLTPPGHPPLVELDDLFVDPTAPATRVRKLRN